MVMYWYITIYYILYVYIIYIYRGKVRERETIQNPVNFCHVIRTAQPLPKPGSLKLCQRPNCDGCKLLKYNFKYYSTNLPGLWVCKLLNGKSPTIIRKCENWSTFIALWSHCSLRHPSQVEHRDRARQSCPQPLEKIWKNVHGFPILKESKHVLFHFRLKVTKHSENSVYTVHVFWCWHKSWNQAMSSREMPFIPQTWAQSCELSRQEAP